MTKGVFGLALPCKALVSPPKGIPKIDKLFLPGYSGHFFYYPLFVQKKYQIILQSLLCVNFRLSPFIYNYLRANNYFWHKACFCILHNFYELFHKVYGIQTLPKPFFPAQVQVITFVSLCNKFLPILFVGLPELFAAKGLNSGLKYLVAGHIRYLLR
jgi:hypothetical protein